MRYERRSHPRGAAQRTLSGCKEVVQLVRVCDLHVTSNTSGIGLDLHLHVCKMVSSTRSLIGDIALLATSTLPSWLHG